MNYLYYESPAQLVKRKARHVFRELFLCWIAGTIIWGCFLFGFHDGIAVAIDLAWGLPVGFALWICYRALRFTLGF